MSRSAFYSVGVPPITLLTDFGLNDTYVSQVKGAILALAPGVSLVDVTHAVPAQDVAAGAFLLWSAVEAFAAGTVHVAVVDPGVGSPRRGLALAAGRGDLLVGPDNGLLTPAAERLGGILGAVELSEPAYWRGANPSVSFHGRDIFGPVAAHLARGVPLGAFGPFVADLVRLALPEPQGLRGEVLHVDTYGNLVTNISGDALPADYRVAVNGWTAPRLAYYAAAAPDALLALVGSAGLLEISVREGSAAQLTDARRGTPVVVEPV